MRAKGCLGTFPISLAELNSILKPNATIMVSKKFAFAIKQLLALSNEEAHLRAYTEDKITPTELR